MIYSTIGTGKTLISKSFQDRSRLSNRQLNNRHNGVSEFQSSNTLQNSSIWYSFPMNARWNNNKSNSSDLINTGNYVLPSQTSTRAAGIGYGERFSNNGKQYRSVAPNSYDVGYNAKRQRRGISIHEKLSDFRNKANYPGPGAYNIAKKNFIQENPISIKSRPWFYYDEEMKGKNIISPQKYFPNINCVKINRYQKIGIGYGNKLINELIGVKNNPGPGAYNLPSQFDLNLMSKPPIN